MRPDDAIVPPWKRLYRDLASSGPLRRCGLDAVGVFALLLAVSDIHGRIPGARGDTVAQTVGAAIGWPPSEVERPVRLLLQRELLLPLGESGVRFSPHAWSRRQHLQAFGGTPTEDVYLAEREPSDAATIDTAAPSAHPAAPSTAPFDSNEPREPLEFQGKRVPMPGVERVDRLRYRQVEEGTPATGRHRHFPHPPGMPFEVWLSTTPMGVRILQHRREKHPTYAQGVVPAGNVTDPVTATPGNGPVTAGNVTAALPVREVSLVSPVETEDRSEQIQTGNVTAVARVTLPHGGGGVSRETPDEKNLDFDLPELPSLPSADDPRIATGQRLTQGSRALRALIDRANAERRNAVIELGASADAMRYAAMQLQNAGVREHGDAMDQGVRLFDALVSLLRNPTSMAKVLGKWQRVKAAGNALPLAICAHNEGQAMGQLIAEAQKIVRNRAVQGPSLPLEIPRTQAPAIAGDAVVWELDDRGELVERERFAGSGVQS